MRRFFCPVFLAALCSFAFTARADTMFNFTFTGISGPGSTLSFSIPEPTPVQDHNVPPIETYTSVPVTVDGVGGYSGTVDLYYDDFTGPDIWLEITPGIPNPPPYPPSGQPSGETIAELYDFYSVLSLVSQTEVYGTGVIDTFQIDSGMYSLSVPDTQTATVSLTVTAAPEPWTLSLVGPGLLGLLAAKRRRAAA